MPRDLTGAVIAELTAKNLRPILLAELHFQSATSYVWTGTGTITWNGHDWVGVPGQMSMLTETDQVEATNFTLSVSGIPSDLLGSALTECRHGNPVTVWFGMLAADGSVIADPAKACAGVMDVPTIDEGAETSTITLNVESRMARLQRPRILRYTTQDQQSILAGDLGFNNVERIQDWNGTWGKATSVAGQGSCSCSSLWLDGTHLVADVCIPSGPKELEILRKDPILGVLSVGRGTVRKAWLAVVPCVRLTAANGAVWEGAKDTPFILPNGLKAFAASMLYRSLLTDEGPGTLLLWSECVAVEDIGEREVVAIDLGGEVYPCGLRPQRRVWSHNKVKAPVD